MRQLKKKKKKAFPSESLTSGNNSQTPSKYPQSFFFHFPEYGKASPHSTNRYRVSSMLQLQTLRASKGDKQETSNNEISNKISADEEYKIKHKIVNAS